MNEKLNINRNVLYITIDNVRIESEHGIEERNDQFLVYVKDSEPNDLFLGELVKNSNGENIIFQTQQEAREYIINYLKRTIYPPDFLHPLRYTKENLSEIKFKNLLFDIGSNNSDSITDTIEGEIIEFYLAANPPHLPVQAKIIMKNGVEKNLDMFEIKRFRKKNKNYTQSSRLPRQ